MKDIQEIVRIKEQQVKRLLEEIESLRSAIKIMNETDVSNDPTNAPAPGPTRANGAHPTTAPVTKFP
jgi:hypothetical protein